MLFKMNTARDKVADAPKNTNYNINLSFVTFEQLQAEIYCEQNKKIIDDWIDFLVTIDPLEDRSPVPFDQILKKK